MTMKAGDLDLTSVLYWELPHLDSDELDSLSTTVIAEVELRVGQRLSALCTDGELEEFERLVDAGDDEVCAAWLDQHIPDNRQITAGVIEALLAETVVRVGGGSRRRRIDRVDRAQLLRTRTIQNRSPVIDGDDVVVDMVCLKAPPASATFTVISDVLRVHASYPTPVPEDRRQTILELIDAWNAATFLPKLYTVDTGRTLVAEVAFPLAPGLHGELLDYLVAVSLDAVARSFDELSTHIN